MKRIRIFIAFSLLACISLSMNSVRGENATLNPLLTALKQVGPEGEGNAEAAVAWKALTKHGGEAIVPILEAMSGTGPLTRNWMRSAAEAIFARETQSESAVDAVALIEFFNDREHDMKARDLAYDLLNRADTDEAASLIPAMLDDPSPVLRRLAVAQLIAQGESELKDGKIDASLATLNNALSAARDIKQIDEIAKLLRKDLEQTIDLPKHFGFLSHWHLIAPFDNTERKGFDTAYPPEKEINFETAYDGKGSKKVKWQEYATADDYGMVDFNTPFSPLKEVIGYAYTEYNSEEARDVEIRLGCKNAWKIWLNGELVFGRDEYHRGARIDQYILPVKLKKGKSTLLVKACQNEQEQTWTVEWQFQLRLCDSTGTAILATDRKPTPKPEVKTRRRGAEKESEEKAKE